MLSLGARKHKRLIFQKTSLSQQKRTDTVRNLTFFALIATKNVYNTLFRKLELEAKLKLIHNESADRNIN